MSEAKARELLAELVACKELKRDAARLFNAKPAEEWTDADCAAYDSLIRQYAARKPLAWEAARAYLAAVPAPPAEPTVPFDKVVSALQWALDQIGAPDKSRNEQYRRDYHAANYTLFLANGRGFGIRAEDDDAAPAAEPVAQQPPPSPLIHAQAAWPSMPAAERNAAMDVAQQPPPPAEPTRLDQTEIGERGNCYSACIAMLLGLPVAEVPNWQPEDRTGRFDSQTDMARAWLLPRGWTIVEIDATNESVRKRLSHGFYVASGPSPRGILHATVYKDGELWHDPHPDKSGIERAETIEVLVPLCPWTYDAAAEPVAQRRPRELLAEIQLARQEGRDAGWEAGLEQGWKQGRANALEEIETERAANAAVDEPVAQPECDLCRGAGWVRGDEVPSADHDTQMDTMTKYPCPQCDPLDDEPVAQQPPPTVAESHQRIVSGKGAPSDYRRVLGDPMQGVSLGAAPAAAPVAQQPPPRYVDPRPGHVVLAATDAAPQPEAPVAQQPK